MTCTCLPSCTRACAHVHGCVRAYACPATHSSHDLTRIYLQCRPSGPALVSVPVPVPVPSPERLLRLPENSANDVDAETGSSATISRIVHNFQSRTTQLVQSGGGWIRNRLYDEGLAAQGARSLDRQPFEKYMYIDGGTLFDGSKYAIGVGQTFDPLPVDSRCSAYYAAPCVVAAAVSLAGKLELIILDSGAIGVLNATGRGIPSIVDGSSQDGSSQAETVFFQTPAGLRTVSQMRVGVCDGLPSVNANSSIPSVHDFRAIIISEQTSNVLASCYPFIPVGMSLADFIAALGEEQIQLGDIQSGGSWIGPVWSTLLDRSSSSLCSGNACDTSTSGLDDPYLLYVANALASDVLADGVIDGIGSTMWIVVPVRIAEPMPPKVINGSCAHVPCVGGDIGCAQPRPDDSDHCECSSDRGWFANATIGRVGCQNDSSRNALPTDVLGMEYMTFECVHPGLARSTTSTIMSTSTLIGVVVPISILLLLLLPLLLYYWYRTHRTSKGQLLLLQTGKPPALSLPKAKCWHLFLSHTWSTGQDQVGGRASSGPHQVMGT